jgi:hypothetical protein
MSSGGLLASFHRPDGRQLGNYSAVGMQEVTAIAPC